MSTADKNQSIVFNWQIFDLSNEGRQNLGQEMPVAVYRLFEYTLHDVLEEMYGAEKRNEIFRCVGERAGREFCKLFINLNQEFGAFVAQLQQQLKELKIGILRIESVDSTSDEMILTVSEDIDCSGLPMMGKTVCYYDEGFIRGILCEYTKKHYDVREVDCWAKGDRICRFEAKVVGHK